jgi:hypothetical protein
MGDYPIRRSERENHAWVKLITAAYLRIPLAQLQEILHPRNVVIDAREPERGDAARSWLSRHP